VTLDPTSDTALPATPSVLVVDDVSAVRYLVFRLLSDAGYRVFEAESAVEAIEVLQTARPPIGLVILDVVMPAVGGVDLARLIRSRWPGTGMVFMSSYEAQVLAREGLENLNVAFLAKPFTRDELLAKVTEGTVNPPNLIDEERHPQRPT
jgi:two-component system, cell cycle sensor histidine kinase and response regulator CckA